MLENSETSRKIQKLIEINSNINGDYSDPKEQLQQILESAMNLSSGESSSILLRNEKDGSLHFEVALGPKGSEVMDFTLKSGEGIAGWVTQNNRSLIVNDVDEDRRFYAQISRQIGYKTRSILAVPMRVWNHCIGVIEIINKTNGGHFSDEDRQWLEIFANQAALAVINSQARVKDRMRIRELEGLREGEAARYQTLLYQSDAMKNLMAMIDRIATSEASVLIHGESGVGKELAAEQIHARSPRAEGPLVRINCPSIPEQLLESELFGHVKGAFTDAFQDRQGKIEAARGGTLFLDEIADISPQVQAKLLRVLESGNYEPLGSNQVKKADIRILAASNKELEREVQEGRFREDLFYRLNVIPLYIPPLRRRKDDIPMLAEHFLGKFNRELNKSIQGFSAEAHEQLMNYAWPGNIRELHNAVERAAVLCTDNQISPEHLHLAGDSFTGELYLGKSLKDSLNLFKKHLIRSTLLESNWNQTLAAQRLEIQRTYLSRLIKELGIERS
ncbi:sigma-54-dependent Fis family transcriptional regulator [Salinispira pacifica]|uniref:Flagellar regulatory protein FleQ n=1 Tax=Salinispira pacifica TaxID=1307761 RepID=V5WH61_9SPIO|nr:sigma 54-interacting transcriptional regulator [Salinispira pacifica]AHC15162.1 Flagellar regulatory protein FleQ [Salinispira pacifica]